MSRAWGTVALHEIAIIEREVVEATAIDAGTLYVGLENIQSGGDFLNVREVESGELASSKFAFTPRHLLYGKLRPYLAKISRPTFGGICSTDILPVLPGPNLDRDYLAHFLLRPESVSLANSRATGANLPRLSPRALAEIRLPFPPLPEQRRIAGILDKADALRAKRRAAIAQLDTLTQSIFLDMFGNPATNPKGWSRQTLGDITKKITDGEHLNPPFSRTGMPIVMAGDVLEDQVDFGASKMVEIDLGYRFRRKCDPERNDILIVSRGATIGRLCVVGAAPEFCLMGSVILLKPFKDKIDSRFLSVFLKHPVSRHALYKTSGSSAQQAIYLKDVKKMVCIVPPISLQREFARHVAAIEKLKAIHRTSLTKLDALFASLQHRAFRGEL